MDAASGHETPWSVETFALSVPASVSIHASTTVAPVAAMTGLPSKPSPVNVLWRVVVAAAVAVQPPSSLFTPLLLATTMSPVSASVNAT